MDPYRARVIVKHRRACTWCREELVAPSGACPRCGAEYGIAHVRILPSEPRASLGWLLLALAIVSIVALAR